LDASGRVAARTPRNGAPWPISDDRSANRRGMMQRRISVRRPRAATTVAAAALMILAPPALAQSPKIGDPPEAKNMRLVGYSDLHARSAYQPTIHHQRGRDIAYV